MINWKDGMPYIKDDKTYLLKFRSGIICTGRFRYGMLGEPSQDTLAWRCDCCGRFAAPIAYAELES